MAERRIEDVLEQVFFEQSYQGGRAEDANEFINQEKHAEQNRYAPERIDHILADALREQRAAPGSAADGTGGQGIGRFGAFAGKLGGEFSFTGLLGFLP